MEATTPLTAAEPALFDPADEIALYPQEDPEEARRCRILLMHRLEPQDAAGMLVTTLLGPVRAWEIVSGQKDLTRPESEAITREAPFEAVSITGQAWTAARSRWAARAEGPDPEQVLASMARRGAWLAIPEDSDWPDGLAQIGVEQPLGLWGLGDRAGIGTPVERSVAFVGCRDASSYGRSVTAHLAGDLAADGYAILSGAAFGIDAAAHRAALAAGPREPATVAYLACGIDRVYPSAHRELLGQIAERGLVLTEVPPGGSPMRHRFLQRNRLIAASAAVTLVVEARWRSGALNTANHAGRYGRVVGAVPGPVFAAQSVGCHRLVREEGAELISTAEDLRRILTDLSGPALDPLAEPGEEQRERAAIALTPGEEQLTGEQRVRLERQRAVDGLSQEQRVAFDALPMRRPAPLERLVAAAGIGPRQLMPLLGQLERMGLAQKEQEGWRVAASETFRG